MGILDAHDYAPGMMDLDDLSDSDCSTRASSEENEPASNHAEPESVPDNSCPLEPGLLPLSATPVAAVNEERQEDSTDRTTVMLRNIPNNYCRQMLITMLDSHGFAGRYDFLYLPIDFRRKANLGYAFINLVDTEATQALWKAFDGF